MKSSPGWGLGTAHTCHPLALLFPYFVVEHTQPSLQRSRANVHAFGLGYNKIFLAWEPLPLQDYSFYYGDFQVLTLGGHSF